MGPLGGALMTVAAPALLITQVYYEGIGIVDAAQYYQATGDNRLLMVRSSFFLTDFTLTFLTWRLRPPTCNCLAHCFPAGTLVATEHGQRAIETVREGERVWAMDLKDGQWKLRHVLQTFERVNDQDLLSIKIGDETIQVTPGHPFWVVRGEDLESRPWPEHAGVRLANAALQGRWVDAGELRVGDVLYLKNGELPEIKEILVLEGGQQVYNFQVEELATFGVGARWVLVHNSSDSPAVQGGVYVLKDPRTDEVVRSGRTKDLARREAEHARDKSLKKYKFEVVYKANCYKAQRGLEQRLHEATVLRLMQSAGLAPETQSVNPTLTRQKNSLKAINEVIEP